MAKQYVYLYNDGDGKNKHLLGGKGANLCEMTQIGLNVPPGFVITTEACLNYLSDSDRKLTTGVMNEVKQNIQAIEQARNTSIEQVIATVGGWLLGIAGGVAVLYLIYGGIIYITGGEKGAEKGKAVIVNAIIGIAIIALATVIAQAVIDVLGSAGI